MLIVLKYLMQQAIHSIVTTLRNVMTINYSFIRTNIIYLNISKIGPYVPKLIWHFGTYLTKIVFEAHMSKHMKFKCEVKSINEFKKMLINLGK